MTQKNSKKYSRLILDSSSSFFTLFTMDNAGKQPGDAFKRRLLWSKDLYVYIITNPTKNSPEAIVKARKYIRENQNKFSAEIVEMAKQNHFVIATSAEFHISPTQFKRMVIGESLAGNANLRQPVAQQIEDCGGGAPKIDDDYDDSDSDTMEQVE